MSSHPDIPTELLESPSYQLERLRRRTRDHVESRLTEHGTTMREYWTLTCLVNASASSQSALCELLGIDASDMVRLVDALENRGWARRERDPRDRRRQIVASTKKGKAAQAELHTVVVAAEDIALDESTSKQLKHLRKLAAAIISTEED